MHLPRLAPVLLAAALLATGCTSEPDEPEAFRPPPAGALQDGPCAIVADDVVELGRLAFDLRGVDAPSDADAEALGAAQTRVAGFADAAEPSVKPALDRLVLTGGLVRIQTATGMLREEVLENMAVAYRDAVRACSGEGGPAPAASSG